jgi:hypothetical protein
MFLLLGHSNDPCCQGVRAVLAGQDLDARIIASPLAPPARLTWHLDADGLTSNLYPSFPDRSIDGVLVRDTGWLDRAERHTGQPISTALAELLHGRVN